MATSTSKDKLPFGLLKTDLEYPKWKEKETKAQREKRHIVHTIDLVYTDRFHWCVRTLHISNARRGSGLTNRSYGYTEDKHLVTIGAGPHVLRSVTAYVRKERMKDLDALVTTFNEGLIKAGETRDSISSRRANTASRRRTGFGWGS